MKCFIHASRSSLSSPTFASVERFPSGCTPELMISTIARVRARS